MTDVQDALSRLSAIASDPYGYADEWKLAGGGKVIGTFPMNFPTEIIHAAGALPVVLQDDRKPITVGASLLPEFYCGYTRSLADQVARQALDVFDAFFCVDHCIQLLGAVDVIRYTLPDRPVPFAQFVASMDEPWTYPSVHEKVGSLREQLQDFLGTTIAADDLSASIRAFNRNRRLLRHVYALRRSGRTSITATDMQVLVKSSMVMDIEEHTAILAGIVDRLVDERDTAAEKVKLHLSGHFCHAPRPELLDAIEDCGAVVVDDDLYTGFRYISTDVPEDGDPVDALARWYLERNVTVPCATRVQNDVDWDTYLLESLRESGAAGVIVLLAKFCEPHMLYYPELRKALARHGVPHLLIETEHEGLPLETIRTRVETLLERIRRGAAPALASA